MCVFHCLPLQNKNVKSPEFACKPDGNPTENYGSFHSELTQHCSRTLSWSRRGPANREILNKITNSFLGDVFFNVAVRLLKVLKFKPDTAQCSTMRVRRNRVRDFYIICLKPRPRAQRKCLWSENPSTHGYILIESDSSLSFPSLRRVFFLRHSFSLRFHKMRTIIPRKIFGKAHFHEHVCLILNCRSKRS